jgi:hypothetical protein
MNERREGKGHPTENYTLQARHNQPSARLPVSVAPVMHTGPQKRPEARAAWT